MLTADDIRSVPLFALLAEPEIERLAHSAADIHLAPGEFAVPEGGERALYAVLAGKIEVVKLFDGVERTLGWRLPGSIFGEVPLALAAPFPGGYRASEPSRVVRVDASEVVDAAAVTWQQRSAHVKAPGVQVIGESTQRLRSVAGAV